MQISSGYRSGALQKATFLLPRPRLKSLLIRTGIFEGGINDTWTQIKYPPSYRHQSPLPPSQPILFTGGLTFHMDLGLQDDMPRDCCASIELEIEPACHIHASLTTAAAGGSNTISRRFEAVTGFAKADFDRNTPRG